MKTLWAAVSSDGHLYFATDDEAVAEARRDCEDFVESNEEDLEEAGDDGQNGHDFWLTRNRHGTGFWDRGYGEVGERLTKAAHVYGEVYIYVGDDGQLYFG